MTDVCKTCRFWQARTWTSERGACRRYPPQFSVSSSHDRDSERDEVESNSCFPSTDHDDWCGEYEKGSEA